MTPERRAPGRIEFPNDLEILLTREFVNADSVLASAERSALVTLTRYSAQGSAEIAGASTDLILARHHDRLHLFSRDPHNPAKLVPSPWKGSNVRDTVAGLLT